MRASDAWNALGVEPGSSEEEIKAAYRRQAMKHHPDRNPGDPGAEERFKHAKDAYESLTCGGTPEGAASSGSPFEDIFGRDGISSIFASIFGDMGQSRIVVRLSFKEALSGCERVLPGDSGAQGVRVEIPAGVADDAEFAVSIGGRRKVCRIKVAPPPGWHLEGDMIWKDQALTRLDQILGGHFELSIPEGAAIKVEYPPSLDDSLLVELSDQKLSGYRIAVKLDFSKPLRLNDNERDQISIIRASHEKRESKNDK